MERVGTKSLIACQVPYVEGLQNTQLSCEPVWQDEDRETGSSGVWALEGIEGRESGCDDGSWL